MSDIARLRLALIVGVIASALAVVGAVTADWWLFGTMVVVAVSQAIVVRSLRRRAP